MSEGDGEKEQDQANFLASISRGDEEMVDHQLHTEKVTPEQFSDLSYWKVPVSVAAVNGYVRILNKLLRAGFLPHKDRHPLHFACSMGHMNVVKSLVEDHKVDLMQRDSRGQTPLYLAVFNNKYDVVKYLLKTGCDVNNGGRMPPIVIAVIHYKLDLVVYLIEQGASVNVRDNFGRSPLGAAARTGSMNIAHVLLEAGADVNFMSREGTPFLAACRSHRLQVVKLLYSHGADIHVCDKDGDNALILAVLEGHYDIARYLAVELCIPLDCVNENSKTAFQIALENMDVDTMYLLHQAGYRPVKELSKYIHFETYNPAKDILFQCISDLKHASHSLVELASFVVRRNLRHPIAVSVESLPVPQTVRDQILLAHIPPIRTKQVHTSDSEVFY